MITSVESSGYETFTFAGTKGEMTLDKTALVYGASGSAHRRVEATFSVTQDGTHKKSLSASGSNIDHKVDEAHPENNVGFIRFEKEGGDVLELECATDTNANGLRKIIMNECYVLRPAGVALKTVITNSNTGSPNTNSNGMALLTPSVLISLILSCFLTTMFEF